MKRVIYYSAKINDERAVLLRQSVYDVRPDAGGAGSKVTGDNDAAAFVRAQEKYFVQYA